MHDLSFFLLKNWLPVGLAAIVFFSIGLLLAKFTWGRFSQRLTSAIEENMNLAGQWSALGASQRDLFKKLRVRWQSDRDVWESAISEKDLRISALTRQFDTAGMALPVDQIDDAKLKAKVQELEAALKNEKEEVVRLRSEVKTLKLAPLSSDPTVGLVDASAADQQARIRDLEQDLIDTHDELHEVRLGYEKQVKLVESLEARLIGNPAPVTAAAAVSEAVDVEQLVNKLAEAENFSKIHLAEATQLRALLFQRNRELKHFRSLLGARDAELDQRHAALSEELSARKSDMAVIENELLARTGELAGAREKLIEMEILQRRKTSLQAELNDACHELYDVRRGLNNRVSQIGLLETRLTELADTEARNKELAQLLAENREELASTRQALSESGEKLKDGDGELAGVRQALSENLLENESLNRRLGEARHELSDVRLAYAEKVAELEKSKAQMEELEAIIEDRTAEVNDLSTELRSQRDQVRLIKNTLAETEGELEALADESKVITAGMHAKEAYSAEQQLRIAALELALSERYSELNLVRAEADELSTNARHFEAQAKQLGAELDRRVAEFSASDLRVTTAEEAVEAAHARIAVLSGKLEQSEQSIAQLQEELRQLSRDKDDTIRELDRATRRIALLEEAAQTRESQLSEIDHALRETKEYSSDLDRRLARLNTELELARTEQEISRAGITELEESLRESDGRTLQLSGRLEEKETEVTRQLEELAILKMSLDASEARELEAQARLVDLQSELDARLSDPFQGNAPLSAEEQEEADRHNPAIVALKALVFEQTAKLEDEAGQRSHSLIEIAGLREKLDKRMEVIRDLQVQINSIMMQRSSQDSEISMLKDKLRAVEEDLSNARNEGHVASLASGVSLSAPLTPFDEVNLAAAIQHSLTTEPSDAEGIALDDLAGKKTHHTPLKAAEAANAPGGAAPKRQGSDDNAVYFNEATAALSASEIEKIDLCAREIRRFGRKAEVNVIGYAGAEGTPDFTESLSARRADAVRERLLERGVSQAVVTVRGAGQDRRFSDWKARRVEMIVIPRAVAETVN